MDSGLVFERPLKFAGNDFIQTLEPRAFYLYIPERDQDDIPLFDTNLRTFTMGSLFSHDRFTGPDRVGDANQLTLALTNRIIDEETGRERRILIRRDIPVIRCNQIKTGFITVTDRRDQKTGLALIIKWEANIRCVKNRHTF